MADKPTVYPDWAVNTDGTDNDVVDPDSGQNNVVEPAAGIKLTGWAYAELPPRQYFNWLSRIVTQWIRWFDDYIVNTIDSFISSVTSELSDHDGRIEDIEALTGAWDATNTIPCTVYDAATQVNANVDVLWQKRGRIVTLTITATVGATANFSGSDLSIKPQSGNFPADIASKGEGSGTVVLVPCVLINKHSTFGDVKCMGAIGIPCGSGTFSSCSFYAGKTYTYGGVDVPSLDPAGFLSGVADLTKGVVAQSISYMAYDI